MGLLSRWKGKGAPPPAEAKGGGWVFGSWKPAEEASRMNGAVEIRRPLDVTVFVFGSAAASGDKVTLAGYCPVFDELEPCLWEIITAAGSDAPQFRIVF